MTTHHDGAEKWKPNGLEDDDVWLTQSLIASCIGTQQNCGARTPRIDPDIPKRGEFFAGLDLAQTRDYSVLSVVEQQDDQLYLRHLKIFQQPTLYATVLGYIKALQDRWGGFERIRVDFTREGPSFIADMENAGIETLKASTLVSPAKAKWQGYLNSAC